MSLQLLKKIFAQLRGFDAKCPVISDQIFTQSDPHFTCQKLSQKTWEQTFFCKNFPCSTPTLFPKIHGSAQRQNFESVLENVKKKCSFLTKSHRIGTGDNVSCHVILWLRASTQTCCIETSLVTKTTHAQIDMAHNDCFSFFSCGVQKVAIVDFQPVESARPLEPRFDFERSC